MWTGRIGSRAYVAAIGEITWLWRWEAAGSLVGLSTRLDDARGLWTGRIGSRAYVSAIGEITWLWWWEAAGPLIGTSTCLDDARGLWAGRIGSRAYVSAIGEITWLWWWEAAGPLIGTSTCLDDARGLWAGRIGSRAYVSAIGEITWLWWWEAADPLIGISTCLDDAMGLRAGRIGSKAYVAAIGEIIWPRWEAAGPVGILTCLDDARGLRAGRIGSGAYVTWPWWEAAGPLEPSACLDDAALWALVGGARTCCCALPLIFSAIWFEDVEPLFSFSPPCSVIVDSVSWVVEIPEGPAPWAIELWGCGIWRSSGAFPLLRRLYSLSNFPPLVRAVNPFLTAPKRQLNSFEGKRQLNSPQKIGLGGGGTSKNCLSRSRTRASAALSEERSVGRPTRIHAI